LGLLGEGLAVDLYAGRHREGRRERRLEDIARSCQKLLLSTPAVVPEPISPELVLVDPELARRERARLEEKAYLQEVLAVSPLKRAVEVQRPAVEEVGRRTPWQRDFALMAKRRLVPAALLCSLLANGLFVARIVSHNGEEATQVAVRVVTITASSPETTTTPTFPGSAAGPPTGPRTSQRTSTISRALTAKASVERKVVSLILTAPTRKLPRAFIDPATGLVKNNVQVICKKRQRRSFLCAVRLASQSAGKALFVRYRPTKDGRGVFRWYGYKKT